MLTTESSPSVEAPVRPPRRLRWWRWVDASSDRRLFALVVLPLVVIYLATANTTRVQANDAIATAMAADTLVSTGSLDSTALEDSSPWLREGRDGRLVPNRFPGAILVGVPGAWIHDRLVDERFSHAPGALTAAVVTAVAMGVVALVLRRRHSPAPAAAGAFVLALATPTWGISADILWTHGATQLWLATALLALVGERYVRAGWAYALAILTRPPTAVVAAVAGLGAAWRRRAWGPALRVGVPAAVGLLAYLAWNWWWFGELDLVGGYHPESVERIATTPVWTYLENVAGTLVSPARGVLVHTPALVVLVLGLRAGWRRSPGWVRHAAVAGLVYLLVHLRINRFSGGFDFITYRIPIETLTVATPLLVAAYVGYVHRRGWLRTAFWTLAGASASLQLLVAISPPRDVDAGPWSTGELETAFVHAHPGVVAAMVAIPVAAFVLARRWPVPSEGAAADPPPADAALAPFDPVA